MAHTDDPVVPTRPRFSWFTPTAKAKSAQTRIDGYASILAHPTYQRLLHAEPWFRRLIPFFVISFLVLIGIARGVQLHENRDVTLETARDNISLIANLIESRFNQYDVATLEAMRDVESRARLADFMPANALKNGRQIMLIKNNGRIIAKRPLSPENDGVYLSDILDPTQVLMTFGKRAGVPMVTLLENGEPTLASLHQLPGDFGALVIYQPREKVLTQWRADVGLNTSIFLGTGILLLVVLYAFFSQSVRADEADKIYHETYARFDTALDRGKCGLWDWDISRGNFFWSPSMYAMLSMPPREGLIGFGELDQLIHPDDVDLFETADHILEGKITQVDQSYRIRNSHNEWRWMRTRGQVVYHPEDGTPHLVGICIDVTEQVQLEQEKKTANVRLRDSIETLSEAFVLWDSRNRLVVCNEKYRVLNNLPREILVAGAPYDEIMAAGEAPDAVMHLNEDNADTSGHSYEIELADGRWLQVNERRTKDGGYVSIGNDITRIKRNEEDLRVREHELKDTVATLEQSKNELRDLAIMLSAQREIAEEANLAKAEFLANISHEWRTPLNAIIGFSDMMKNGVLGPLGTDKYQEYCDDIYNSGTYMLDFINDVLNMSQIEAGAFELDFTEIDLVEVVQNAVGIASADGANAHIEVAFRPEEIEPIIADRRGVKQVLHNLLSNAIKFNKEGGAVHLTCTQNSSVVSICVTDTGIGIPEDDLPKIGRPFRQVQSQMTKNHTGSGLGLAISKSIVEMHGGVFDIQSKFGEGTQVTFTLPRLQSAIAC